jgi:hypothetical protein
VFDPTFEHVNDVLLNTLLEIEQLSVEPFSTSATAKVALPLASNVNVNGVFALITGAVLSSTVIVAVAVAVLPLLSVTVNVTTFVVPKFVQSNAVLPMLNVLIPQLSVEPSFTSEAAKLAFPMASKVNVTFFALAVGAATSCTVTVITAVDVLPLASLTV